MPGIGVGRRGGLQLTGLFRRPQLDVCHRGLQEQDCVDDGECSITRKQPVFFAFALQDPGSLCEGQKPEAGQLKALYRPRSRPKFRWMAGGRLW